MLLDLLLNFLLDLGGLLNLLRRAQVSILSDWLGLSLVIRLLLLIIGVVRVVGVLLVSHFFQQEDILGISIS